MDCGFCYAHRCNFLAFFRQVRRQLEYYCQSRCGLSDGHMRYFSHVELTVTCEVVVTCVVSRVYTNPRNFNNYIRGITKVRGTMKYITPGHFVRLIPLYYLFLVHLFTNSIASCFAFVFLMVNDFLLLSPMLCWCWHGRPLLMDLSDLLCIQYT